ncbi:hypothetical protein Ddc_09866 [Ditylenchus destructor]|nr:hypothetical protein Ddc_09866 [Ditylenchus destructor]
MSKVTFMLNRKIDMGLYNEFLNKKAELMLEKYEQKEDTSGLPSEFEIIFDSEGGVIECARLMVEEIKKIKKYKIKVHGIIGKDKKCMSAASFVFGVCSDHSMHKKSSFMLHGPCMDYKDCKGYKAGVMPKLIIPTASFCYNCYNLTETSLRFTFFQACHNEYVVLKDDIDVMIAMACDGGFQFWACPIIVSDIFQSKDDTTFKIGTNLDKKVDAKVVLPNLVVFE